MSHFSEIIEPLRGGLIVSCQASEDSPLHGPVFMAAMARAAELNVAAGIRANGVADVSAIRAAVDLPIIGIDKWRDPDHGWVVITPDFAAAERIVEAGADIVAISCAFYQRDRVMLAELISRIRTELHVPVMADCATFAEGIGAAGWGADIVATTLSGYTPDTQSDRTGPDLELVTALAAAQPRPVIAEGRVWSPEEARAAIDAGAFAVVVGTAITAPGAITGRFASAVKGDA